MITPPHKMHLRDKKLRLGVLLDSLEVPAWIAYSLHKIADSGCAEFTIVVLNDGSTNETHTPGLRKLWKKRAELAYRIFNKIDEKVFYREPDAFKKVKLQELLAGSRTIPVKPVSAGDSDAFPLEVIRTLQEHDLDILIKFGFRQLSGDILTAARFGVWLYDHSDIRTNRGGPPGFWEVVEKWPESGATLSIAAENSQRKWIIFQSRLFTHPFSPARNRNTIFWAAASFLPRQIELLSSLGGTRFFKETAKFNSDLDFYDRKPYCLPTNLVSIEKYAGLLVRNLLELAQRALFQFSWYLMVDFSIDKRLTFANFTKILPPRDRFWADPHVIQEGDSWFIFIEEFLYKNRKGHISVMEIDRHGKYKDPIPVIETDYHLSYPFVFEYNQTYYMVPESLQRHSITLYECVEFPAKWKFKMNLMENVNAVDSTLFFYHGKWWLFTGLAENEGALPEVELFLFYSDDLFTTEWKSHPLNPIVSDVTNARPAGRLFELDGKVYRPSQDCSRNYGYGFNINEILCLTETDYQERKVAAVKPDWDRRLIATHTYASAPGIHVIDGVTRRSKLF